MSAGTRFALGTFARDAGADGNGAASDRGPLKSFAGLVIGERVVALERHLGPGTTVRGLVDDWPTSFPRLQAIADDGEQHASDLELASLRPLPPVLPCGQIFQAGANYRQHVLDLISGAEGREDESDGFTADMREDQRRVLDERARSGSPFVFTGSVHALAGAEDDIVLPPEHSQYDWEVELGVVIGRTARRVSREQALETVAGYLVCNDVTTRDALTRPDVPGGIDWLAAKNSPTFLPTGPLLVPAAHVSNPMELDLTLSVNGQIMQNGTTADMMFDVARLIEYISTKAELRAGDLLLTGSPAGNGSSLGVFLRPGDVIEGSITGLGTQRNRCVAEQVPADLAAR
jgi:2-keto-4-pentenoate hydratase/2-oxohepta-3-ene-1,7-dioic acid hydratase in catechol pathway